MSELGLIQVYTGNGKGKTTASLGLALRAVGHGFKVCMLQFMKNNPLYGEVKASTMLTGFTLMQVGRNEFVNLKNPDQIDIQLARQGWEKAREIISSNEYDLVILDEINVAMACKLIAEQEVINFLQAKPSKVEVVLTGRYAPQALIEMADLVTEMCEVKHPYNKGVPARAGIDY